MKLEVTVPKPFPFLTAAETNDGIVTVMTKQRYFFGLFPHPHTSILPRNAADLKRLGTVIKWTTDDPETLANLHDAVVRLAQEVGASGLAEIANSAKVAMQVSKRLGGHGLRLREIAALAAQDGVEFPLPPEVLKYVGGFM